MYHCARIVCYVSIGTLLVGVAVNNGIASVAGIAGIVLGGVMFMVADKREKYKHDKK